MLPGNTPPRRRQPAKFKLYRPAWQTRGMWLLTLGLVLLTSGLMFVMLRRDGEAQPPSAVPVRASISYVPIQPSPQNPGVAAPLEPLVTLQPSGSKTAVRVSRASRFDWPASGPISTYFGAFHPTGMDIALAYDENSPIYASAGGRVDFAGGETCCGYGLHVILHHDDGSTTLYGHLSEIEVKEGDRVSKAQRLGWGGDTGESTGKHLHFEVEVDGAPVDPLRYLSPSQLSYDARDTTDCNRSPVPIRPDSVVNLDFGWDFRRGYEIATALISPSDGNAPFSLEPEPDGPLKLRLLVPAAPIADGQTVDYRLDVTFRRDPNAPAPAATPTPAAGQETTDDSLTCTLTFSTLKTYPNPPQVRGRAPVSPTPSRTPTPRPGATSTAVPAQVAVATAVPTRVITPVSPQQSVPTPNLGPPGQPTKAPSSPPTAAPTTSKPSVLPPTPKLR